MVRCEYCGQLYEGLSCPYCCAPRGESEPVKHNGVSSDDCPERILTYPDEWILTNSSCVGDNNVQVIGDNNVVNGFYADNVLYWIDRSACLGDQPSERDETIDVIYGTCTHDAQASAKVRELAKEQAKKRDKDRRRWDVINLICAWLGSFCLCMVIGAPVGHSIGIATMLDGVFYCCLAAGYD